MTVTIKEMIYIKDNRVIFTPVKEEYDVTDNINDLVIALNHLKTR